MKPTPEPASVINMAIVGGGTYCPEILEKTTLDFNEKDVNARFRAVADRDRNSPGMLLARQLNLMTFGDYHDLYDPCHDIHLIILLTPVQEVLDDILATRPKRIRILSYHVFEIFWKAIGLEERKLRERTKEMETILNGIQDFILVITPDMEVVEANDAFLKKMGKSYDQVTGRKCYDAFNYDNQVCLQDDPACPLEMAIRNKRECHQVRTHVGKDGEKRHFEVSIYPVWEKDGKISKFIHISHDITQRLREEEEITRRLEAMVAERTRQLQETHEKLLHQDKMSSLGKLSASVVHEINNPIAGVLNLIVLIKRILSEERPEARQIDQFSGYLDLMETETKRISRIVSNLLAFARQSKIEPMRLNVNRLLEQTLILNANLLKINGVRVEHKLAPDLPDLTGSTDQLLQVFMNLVSNAVEAMEGGGGVLSIETRYRSNAGHISVKFKDSGSGIPAGDYSKLFEPFFTTKKGKGMGLGLSVAYGIVQEHGGSIYVNSREGAGSAFTVKLPLEPAQT